MSGRSDRWSAAVWAVFGLIVAVASWRLDRLESLHINPWSAPGLTPGVVGILIVLLAVALAVQSRRAAPDEPADPLGADALGADPLGSDPLGADPIAPTGGDPSRTLLAIAMCVVFAGASLGHGLPFAAEGAAFVFAFITIFSWAQWRAERRRARGLLMAIVTAVAASGLISWLFESVFLVRLP